MYEPNDFKDAKLYTKFGKVLWRHATPGETVLTVIKGVLETANTAKTNDVVVKNFNVGQSTEEWIISYDKLKERYFRLGKTHLIDGKEWQLAEARGFVKAIEHRGESFEMTAPWGEHMIVNDGDFIAQNVNDEDDIYRIEREQFLATYKEHV